MNDTAYIRRAFELAERGAGLTSPGAMVGAVIVKDGAVIGEGFYTWDGIRHAEIIALEQAGAAARGATVYTSLEPCSHQGRTPPCTKALIDAGVARVVSGMQVECGMLEQEARRLNEAFITYKTKHRPFGILKIAMTLDGKIATRFGES